MLTSDNSTALRSNYKFAWETFLTGTHWSVARSIGMSACAWEFRNHSSSYHDTDSPGALTVEAPIDIGGSCPFEEAAAKSIISTGTFDTILSALIGLTLRLHFNTALTGTTPAIRYLEKQTHSSLHNWGEPERAPHRRLCCKVNHFLLVFCVFLRHALFRADYYIT